MAFSESDYQAVSELVRNTNPEYAEFVLFGENFMVITCISRNAKGSPIGDPAEYHTSSGDYGPHKSSGKTNCIYIWDSLEEKIQQVLLFHELVEIGYQILDNLPKEQAHQLTLPWEKRFREEYLNESELERFLEFEEEYRPNPSAKQD